MSRFDTRTFGWIQLGCAKIFSTSMCSVQSARHTHLRTPTRVVHLLRLYFNVASNATDSSAVVTVASCVHDPAYRIRALAYSFLRSYRGSMLLSIVWKIVTKEMKKKWKMYLVCNWSAQNALVYVRRWRVLYAKSIFVVLQIAYKLCNVGIRAWIRSYRTIRGRHSGAVFSFFRMGEWMAMNGGKYYNTFENHNKRWCREIVLFMRKRTPLNGSRQQTSQRRCRITNAEHRANHEQKK